MNNLANQMEKRRQAVELVLEKCLLWYAANSGGKVPEEIRELNYDDGARMLRYLEPALPGLENPVVVEEYTRGRFWTVRIECRETFRPGDL